MPDSLTLKEEQILTFPKPVFERASDYTALAEALSVLDLQYSCLRVTGIGETMLGRTIYAVTLGNPDAPGVLYTGGIHAGDSHSTAALLRLISDYGEFCERGKRMYGVSMTYLNASRSITVIPMLNPDGISIYRKTAEPLHRIDILREDWTGNARNADLMTDFETVCREAETCAVTGYIKTMGNIEMSLCLHPSESGLSYNPDVKRAVPVGRLLARMIGCPVKKSACGMAKWFSDETGKPAYTCSAFENKSLQPDDYITLYAALREAMFSMPLLI